MNIRIGIVEDEANASMLLKSRLKEVDHDLEVVFTADSLDTAIRALEKQEIDLLFLDIHLDDRNGFELFAELEDIPFEVIFTTAHSRYSLSAFRVNALDYLLKPYSKEEVKDVIEKFVLKKSLVNEEFIGRMESLFTEDQKVKRLVIKERGKISFPKVDEVNYVEADGAYCHIHLINNQMITCSRNLSYMQEKLKAHNFIRVHKSYLINPLHVEEFNSFNHEVLLTNKKAIPISAKSNKELIRIMEG